MPKHCRIRGNIGDMGEERCRAEGGGVLRVCLTHITPSTKKKTSKSAIKLASFSSTHLLQDKTTARPRQSLKSSLLVSQTMRRCDFHRYSGAWIQLSERTASRIRSSSCIELKFWCSLNPARCGLVDRYGLTVPG